MTSRSGMRAEEMAGAGEGADLFKRYNTLPKRLMSFDSVVAENFATLPVPILVRIFGFLNNHDLLRNISFVCKHWRYAVMQPGVLKTFRISEGLVNRPFIYNHLRKGGTLCLYIQDVSDPMDILVQASKFLQNLKKLHLVNCGDLDFKILKYIIQTFTELETLDLEETNFHGLSNYSRISHLYHIKSLSLNKMKNLSIQDIMETVLNCKRLEELNIGLLPPLVDLRDADACLIIGNLKNQLKSLTIDARSLTNKTFQKIFECKSLIKLYINFGVNLTSDFYGALWEQLPDLKELGLSNNSGVNRNRIRLLFNTGNVTAQDIVALDLTHCILVDDLSIETIANCCKKLLKVHLKSCKRVTRIDALCANCKELSFLNIAFCGEMKLTFEPPHKLEKLIVHENDKLENLLQRFKHQKHLRIYTAVSEYTDYLKRLKKT